MKVFSVYDCKVDAFMLPFFSKTTASGARSFEQAVNNPELPYFHHPDDYTLFEIGEFDEKSGQVMMHQTHVSLGLAVSFKRDVGGLSPQTALA